MHLLLTVALIGRIIAIWTSITLSAQVVTLPSIKTREISLRVVTHLSTTGNVAVGKDDQTRELCVQSKQQSSQIEGKSTEGLLTSKVRFASIPYEGEAKCRN